MLTHGFHRYPAVMNPYIARKLIRKYGKNSRNLLDPFCGSGTTLVEAGLSGLSADGFDLNPVARLISKAKTQPYDIGELSDFIIRLIENIHTIELNDWSDAVRDSGFTGDNIRTWFPDKSVQEISTYLQLIEDVDVKDEGYRIFAKVALSDCLRGVSIQRNSEWKNYRKEGWRDENINTNYRPLGPQLEKKLKSNLEGVKNTYFIHRCSADYIGRNIRIYDTNSVNETDFPSTPGGGYDLVVTSPPYGDSRTTVAYAEFSWMANVWLGMDQRTPGKLGKEMMGGVFAKDVRKFGHPAIDSSISKMDHDNAIKNFSFYRDYLQSIQNIAQNIGPGGVACFVVGNRTSGGQLMRMDLFTRWALEKNGFERIGAIKNRRISNTRMPMKVSPSGKKGDVLQSMNYEYIITCRKGQ